MKADLQINATVETPEEALELLNKLEALKENYNLNVNLSIISLANF